VTGMLIMKVSTSPTIMITIKMMMMIMIMIIMMIMMIMMINFFWGPREGDEHAHHEGIFLIMRGSSSPI
jgi:hypothetical protein